MQHGIYVAEFERELFHRGFAIGHRSLGQLVNQVDFSKLKDFPESDRISFYEALAESIPRAPRGRGVEAGIQILREVDSDRIVKAMSSKAAARKFASSRIRDVWCQLFIAGCP
jgi:hypothetical protein